MLQRSSRRSSAETSAAGTWYDVFGIEPHRLVGASEGLVSDLKRG